MAHSESSSKKRTGLDFETVGSIVAIVIGLAALYVSWQEASNARQDRLASSLPVMETGVGVRANDGVSIAIRAENAGAGTALVYSAALRVDGEIIDGADALQAALLGDALPPENSSITIDGIELRPLVAGESIEPFVVSWDPAEIEGEVSDDVFNAIFEKRVTLDVCFCDIYERCWLTQTQAFPTPVEECPPPTGFPNNLLP